MIAIAAEHTGTSIIVDSLSTMLDLLVCGQAPIDMRNHRLNCRLSSWCPFGSTLRDILFLMLDMITSQKRTVYCQHVRQEYDRLNFEALAPTF
jgi:hypothetical protein